MKANKQQLINDKLNTLKSDVESALADVESPLDNACIVVAQDAINQFIAWLRGTKSPLEFFRPAEPSGADWGQWEMEACEPNDDVVEELGIVRDIDEKISALITAVDEVFAGFEVAT